MGRSYQWSRSQYICYNTDFSITDWDELAIFGTKPIIPDTDGDGISDTVEIDVGTDPHNPIDQTTETPSIPEFTLDHSFLGALRYNGYKSDERFHKGMVNDLLLNRPYDLWCIPFLLTLYEFINRE